MRKLLLAGLAAVLASLMGTDWRKHATQGRGKKKDSSAIGNFRAIAATIPATAITE
jgi:hypothetical protein